MSFQNIVSSIMKISCTTRYSQFYFAKSENVLEHTGMVAMLCVAIHKKLELHGFHVDKGILLERAIVHDFDEAFTGDIARPIKYSSHDIRKALKSIEIGFVKKFDYENNFNGSFCDAWMQSKCNVEGKIVSVVDTLTVIIKLHDEICNRGNLSAYDCLSPDASAHVPNMISEIQTEVIMTTGSRARFLDEISEYVKHAVVEMKRRVGGVV